jgi:SulP family sulfate permease
MTSPSIPIQPAQSNRLLPNISAGLALGFVEVIFSISIASLIFSGPLREYLPRGVTIVLVTSIISILIPALFSSYVGVIAGIQENPAVLLTLAVASLTGLLGAQSGGTALLPTILAMILVTTLLTGFFLLLLGTFRLGGLMRYIPYPVIGGFMAGTGWLLAQGSISVTADYPLQWDTLGQLMQPDQILLWLPGVVFGLALFVGVRGIDHYATMPGLLLGGLAVFFVLLLVGGISVEAAMERGLLLGEMGNAAAWQPLPLGELRQADWGVLLGQAGNIGTIVLLAAINLLLNVSGLELALRKDLDLNRELRAAGITNMLSGLAGGMVGYHDLSYTMLNHRVGGRGRLAGLIAGGVCIVILLFGTAALSYVPKSLLGGLLLFMGLNFLEEWIVQGWKRLDHIDYGVVLLILVIIVASNFLVGVSVGLLLMIAIFVWNYSRINIFHHILSGAEIASHVERNATSQRELVRLGKQIYILELQGFIFFGTANTVLEQINARLTAPGEAPLLFLILDFRRVTGLDSSAMFSLSKVKHLATTHNFALVFTNMAESMKTELARSGLDMDTQIQFFGDLDHGLEWCEEQLLFQSPITQRRIAASLQLQLYDLGFPKDGIERLKSYLQRITLNEGEYLIHQGEPFSDLYFIEIGQVSVYLELENDKRVRVQTPSMGTIVGELGFYIDAPRSASVVADARTIAYRLTRSAMVEMKAKDPELAIAFNDLMLRVIAERLVATNREVLALNR